MIDLHVDSIIQQRLFRYDLSKGHRALLRGQPLFWHADLPRLAQAQYKAACFGIHYWPWESERGWREANTQIDYLDKVIDAQPGYVRVRDHSDWAREEIAVAPGVEGAHMINGKLGRVEELAARNIAYMTLCHFSKNKAVTPSMGRGANAQDGLTEFGRSLVRELEDHDILVDVAHVNMRGLLDVCAMARKPVLCTHTGVKARKNIARNISDEAIDAIAHTRGVIGIMFGPIFLSNSLRADTNCILDHLEHTIQRAGIDHVALGSDYDGWMATIASDQRDCRDAHLVADGLLQRGYSQEDVDKIVWRNALRVLSREP